MRPKERIVATLNRQLTDRTPVDLWLTGEVKAALCRHTGTDSDLAMFKALDLDKIVWNFIGYKLPDNQITGAQAGAQTLAAHNLWGVPTKTVQAGAAEYAEAAEAPLAGYDDPAQLNDYPWWPDVERFDYAGAVAKARTAGEDFAVIGPWVSFFEIYCQMRGLERAMMDLAMSPELVEAVLDCIEDIQTRMLRRLLPQVAEYQQLVFISDDIGGQTGLLLSPSMWDQHLRQRMMRWCDLVHQYGLRVFYHSDGGCEPLIGPLIDCGIDVLNPIQHNCPGMETEALKRKYGERVIFHGGVDNQRILPFGTPEEVRNEVRMLKRTLGDGGRGFICCSCHNVQAGTPVENILAMIDEAKQA